MSIILIPIFTLLLGVLITFLFMYIKYNKLVTLNKSNINILTNENNAFNEKIKKLTEVEEKYYLLLSEKAVLENDFKNQQNNHKEKLDLLKNAENDLKMNFKNLANEIFEKKADQFNKNSGESLEKLLKPFREQIDGFQRVVKENHENDIKERQTLKDSLSTLNKMNVKLSEEATNLTKALKGNTKTQGNWGEMILETLLEKSGLTKGLEYDVQVHSKTEEGKRYLPDVIVHLPETRDVVVDSKVSLKAYESYINSEDETDKESSLKDHIQSLKNHIRELSSKEYQKLNNLDTLDFVFMFIPIEGALITALQADNELFNTAFNKNIIIVGPTTLLATLRTIENVWKNDKQNKNALEIAKKAGDLYDKFVNFVADMEKIGKNLATTQKTYDDALNKLSTGKGCLTTRANAIKELGIKSSKTLTIG